MTSNEPVKIPSSLGLESGTVRVVPYDPSWPALYEAEVDRIRPILSDHGVHVVFEHTGSTSVPGLAAKPILDILAGREASADREGIITALRSAGYAYRGESGIPGRDFFRRGDPRSYHIHLALIGSQFWRDHLAFRNALRRDPEIAARYASLKFELAERFPRDREAYIDSKTDFVRSILESVR